MGSLRGRKKGYTPHEARRRPQPGTAPTCPHLVAVAGARDRTAGWIHEAHGEADILEPVRLVNRQDAGPVPDTLGVDAGDRGTLLEAVACHMTPEVHGICAA